MIWFACKQCGQRHSRPDDAAGTFIFCGCGQGNRVPWRSSDEAAPVVLDAEPVHSVPPVPPLPPILQALPAELPIPTRRPDRPPGKINPSFCFQHPDRPSRAVCAACRLPFCAACVVTLQEQTLCGPCKNFRVAGLARPRRVAPLAVLALVAALVAATVAVVLSLVAVGLYISDGQVGATVLLCLLAALFPLGGLVLSGRALARIDATPHAAGRVLALTAVCLTVVALQWLATVAVLVVCKYALDSP